MSNELVDAELEKKTGGALVDDSASVAIDYRATHSKCLLLKVIKVIHIVMPFI